ncbi:FG-GAP-like repeat-containing protein [Pelagicoccus sp. SDUM812005]|uniref:FG-GAP-like repeat-containing protein n=1 Tax=Pelagicoccus sp. SDUM812005 TaxID=3041257 RepID=UPI00280DF00C|nr:FG-GAP-like repeat-containing protein [Pelagicoccus sp. SDUM812005]MDQ8181482.1 FG-GAP-like repeat-containing protein [Pelagicoccus sp. SDUM812005]
MYTQTPWEALGTAFPVLRCLRALLVALCLPVFLASPAHARFVDVTESAGIDDYERVTRLYSDFVVRGGTPIVMDFDGNGWLDLYIIRYQLDDILYLNTNGVFTKTVNPLGIDTQNGGNVGAWVDIDNDGDKDMIVGVADAKSNLLYLNNGDGTFTEAAAARGLDLAATLENHQSTAVTVGDINRDGYLDVITGSWGVDLTDETRYEHYALFLNQGASNPGHFTNVTQDANYRFFGIGINIFSPAITDLDQDGWPDIATTVDFGDSALHWNNANGTFTDSTAASGVGLANHAMGTAIGDVDNDGDLDWFVTTIAITRNVNGEVNPLYINQGNRLFDNQSVAAGVAFSGWGWGTNLFDYDLDGDLDLVAVNQEDITPEGPTHDGRMFLWRNDRSLKFTDVSEQENANQLSRGAGIVSFDYNNDGALDLFYVNQHSRPTLLRNDRTKANAWLKIKLQGSLSNPDGIGAFVTVQPQENGPVYVREFNPTNAYLAQLSPYLHFGFPPTANIHKVTVRWPSSIVQELTNVSTSQLLTVTEDASLLAGSEIPVFANAPQDQVATRGQPLTLSVSIEGGFRPTITWFRNGVLLAGYEGPEITIDNMQPNKAGTYHAVATNSAGSTQTASFVVGVRSDFSDHNIARQWNELVLDSARINFPDPPIVARTFYHCTAAMWDAYWAYQPDGWNRAQSVFHQESPTLPTDPSARASQQAEALSHAVYTVATERYRKAFNHDAILLALRDFMLEKGYDPDDLSTEGSTPAAVGNRIGNAILSAGLEDGSNEANGYADTTGYAPVNEPLIYGSSGVTLVDPNRWQPLNLARSITKNGIDLGPEVQQFLAPGWNWVAPFALEKPTDDTILIDPGPQPLFGAETEPQLIAEMVEVIRASSLMDPTQEVVIDASPGGLQQNNPWLTQDGQGHSLNPFTGQPYAPNPVNQGDYLRLTAEFWSDGPGIEGPPGVWNMLHNQTSDDPRFVRKLGGVGPELSPLEWDVHAYLALNGALHDAAIAAWTIKSKYDSIRPISMIRYLASLGQSSDPQLPNYHASGLPLEPGLIELVTAASSAPGQRHEHLADHLGELAVYSWKGVPNKPREDIAGVGWVRAADWSPYHLRTFPTPNFAGYVSGHSTFSRAGAEVMALLTGSPFFPGGLKEFDFEAGKYLQVEYGPREDLTIQVATYYDAADLTGVARIYCGVHIAADDFVGRKVGARVGADAVLKTLALRQGNTAPEGFLSTRIQAPLTPLDEALLVSYQAPSRLPVRKASSLSQALASDDKAIYATPAADGQIQFLVRGEALSRIEVLSQISDSKSVTLDFSIESPEPVALLATGTCSETATLALAQKNGESYQPHSSNQNWIQHPSASLASTFKNRRDLAGEELNDNAAALPLLLGQGDYRLTLTGSQTATAAGTLSLDLVRDQ